MRCLSFSNPPDTRPSLVSRKWFDDRCVISSAGLLGTLSRGDSGVCGINVVISPVLSAGYQPPAPSQNYHYEPAPEPPREPVPPAAAASAPGATVSRCGPTALDTNGMNSMTLMFHTCLHVAPTVPVSCPQKRYRAVYDYSAADEDEVSFLDGDVIIDVQQIDEGWMYGRVERTGQQGMLPANYVETI